MPPSSGHSSIKSKRSGLFSRLIPSFTRTPSCPSIPNDEPHYDDSYGNNHAPTPYYGDNSSHDNHDNHHHRTSQDHYNPDHHQEHVHVNHHHDHVHHHGEHRTSQDHHNQAPSYSQNPRASPNYPSPQRHNSQGNYSTPSPSPTPPRLQHRSMDPNMAPDTSYPEDPYHQHHHHQQYHPQSQPQQRRPPGHRRSSSKHNDIPMATSHGESPFDTVAPLEPSLREVHRQSGVPATYANDPTARPPVPKRTNSVVSAPGGYASTCMGPRGKIGDHRTMSQGDIPTTLMQNEAGVTTLLSDLKKEFVGRPNKVVTYDKCIGHGGFGYVWKAKCDQKSIALKELKDAIVFKHKVQSAEEALKELPFYEAAIQMSLVSEYIAHIFWADICVMDAKTKQPLDLSGPRRAATAAQQPSWETTFTVEDRKAKEGGALDSIFDGAVDLPDVVLVNMRIAMELCSMGCLVDYLTPNSANKSPKPLCETIPGGMDQTLCAVLTALDIARGLKLMHITNIVHGDLKPNNILLGEAKISREQPRGFIAKLSDFGLSARLEKKKDSIAIKNGTIPYLPQEALENLAMSKKTDIYAFGLLMWELWHNKFWARLYEQEKKQRGSGCGRQGMYGFIPKCDPACPRDYAAIVEACLSRDASKRPEFKRIVKELEAVMFDTHFAINQAH